MKHVSYSNNLTAERYRNELQEKSPGYSDRAITGIESELFFKLIASLLGWLMELKRLEPNTRNIKNIRDTSEVKNVFVTKIFVAFAARSAWNWTQFDYFSGVLSTTLDSAKKYVEGKRVQGSRWSIQEIPALVVCAKNDSVILCDINRPNPFLNWQPLKIEGNTLRSLVEAWMSRPARRDWTAFISYLSNAMTVEPADQPFIQYQSHSFGSRYSLEWSAFYGSGLHDQKLIDLQHIYKYAGLLASSIEITLKKSD